MKWSLFWGHVNFQACCYKVDEILTSAHRIAQVLYEIIIVGTVDGEVDFKFISFVLTRYPHDMGRYGKLQH